MKQNISFVFLDILWHDILYSIRMIKKSPGQSFVIIITLALGIAVNCATFSIIDAVLIKPLPFPNPEQLVVIHGRFQNNQGEVQHLSAPEFGDLSSEKEIFSDIAVYDWSYANLSGVGEPQRLVGVAVTPSFFKTLQSNPILGRVFTSHDNSVNQKDVVISYNLWQQQFGADPKILNKTILLDADVYTVIGVMPPDFNFPFYNISVWRPLRIQEEIRDESKRVDRSLYTIARLNSGINHDNAQSRLNIFARRLRQEHPEAYKSELKFKLLKKHDEMVRSIRPALLLMFGGISLVILIGCGNVANIVLARVFGRQPEFAVRIILGASKMHLFRQWLTENFLLSGIGSILGILITAGGIHLFKVMGPSDIPYLDKISVNYHVIEFAIGLTALAAIFLSIFPTFGYLTSNLNAHIKESSQITSGKNRKYVHQALVVLQIALSIVLLVGAGLLIKSFYRLQMVSIGFEPTNRLSLRVVLPNKAYPESGQRRYFFQQLQEKVEKLPDVVSVGIVTSLPFADINQQIRFSTRETEVISENTLPRANFMVVSPNYFNVMGIPLLKGQHFPSGVVQWLPQVVVNETLARRFLSGNEVIGKEIKIYGGGFGTRPVIIIGVVADVKHNGLDIPTKPEIYASFLHTDIPSYPLGAMFMVVHTISKDTHIASTIRGELAKMDKTLPLTNVMTLEDRISRSLFPRRSGMLLISASALVAMLLSFVGVSGLISFIVTKRTPEIAVRLALGAPASDVMRLVVGQAVRLALLGILIGVVGSVLLAQQMDRLLFDVSSKDWTVFMASSVLLFWVILAACYLPLRKILKLDPWSVLRND